MNKTGNLILFFIIAFIFSITLFFVFMIAIVVLANLIMGPGANETVYMTVMMVGFMASLVLSFLIYGRVVKWATVRFNLEKHIPQLFKRKK